MADPLPLGLPSTTANYRPSFGPVGSFVGQQSSYGGSPCNQAFQIPSAFTSFAFDRNGDSF